MIRGSKEKIHVAKSCYLYMMFVSKDSKILKTKVSHEFGKIILLYKDGNFRTPKIAQK